MSVFWEITNYCNLKCIHCYIDNSENCDRRMEILNKIISLNVKNVSIGGGEPFVLDDIHVIFKKLYENGIEYDIVTNGTLIDESKLEQYLNNGGRSICISLDGTRNIHDSIRGEGSYDKSMVGLELALSLGLDVSVSVTLNHFTYKYVELLVRELEKYKLKEILINTFIPTGKECDANLVMTKAEIRELYDMIKKIDSINKTSYTPFSLKKKRCDCVNINSDFFTIKHNGEIILCPHLRIPVCNVFDGDREFIYRKITKEKINIMKRKNRKCNECDNQQCSGGCKGYVYNKYGAYEGEYDQCIV